MQVGLEVVESSSYYFVCMFIILFSGVYSHIGMQTIKRGAITQHINAMMVTPLKWILTWIPNF